MSKKLKIIAALLILLLLLSGFFLGVDAAVVAFLVNNIVWIEMHYVLSQIIFVLLLIIIATTGIFPASLLVITAGALFGLTSGLALSLVGIFIGSIGGLLAGRYILREAITSRVSSYVSMDALDMEIQSRGWRFVILLRLSPFVPFGIGSYALGISSVRFKDYCIGTIGTIPALFALVYTGSLTGSIANMFMETEERAWGVVQIAILVMGLVASFVIIFILSKVAYRVTKSVKKTNKQ
ncbi:hypothetical protein MNBD_GAMMA05-1603 [hydrothermal vent metagenome]|uniref:VTT domain-containing protein n=1 Tax=hydrothermal vent metagenome TaxID=652676 RepID=A0A3B0WN08_9ZZZZ